MQKITRAVCHSTSTEVYGLSAITLWRVYVDVGQVVRALRLNVRMLEQPEGEPSIPVAIACAARSQLRAP